MRSQVTSGCIAHDTSVTAYLGCRSLYSVKYLKMPKRFFRGASRVHLGFKVLDFLLPVLNNSKVCRENLTEAPRARGLLTPSRSSAAAASQSAEPDRTGSETQGEEIEHYLIMFLNHMQTLYIRKLR